MLFLRQNFFSIHICMLVIIMAVVPALGIASQSPDGLIAKVNDTTIFREELDREMKLVSFKLTRQGRPVTTEQLKRHQEDIRETLINRNLLLEQSKDMEISVKESLVAKALGEFKAGFKDDKAYEDELAKLGFTEEMMKDQIHDGLIIKSLLDKEVLQKVSVTDQQVRSYYDKNPDLFQKPEQVKASHILIKVPENASAEKKAKALATIKDLKGRIANGENFATLAQDFSDCPSKAKGGDLGFFTKEQMVPPFSKAAFALQPGQTSDVVETRFGYHLIRVTERKSEQKMAFTDVKKAIFTRLRREEEVKRIGDYLDELKVQADVQRFPL